MLCLGQSYPEKLLSISFGEISRNPIPHQIEPIYGDHGGWRLKQIDGKTL